MDINSHDLPVIAVVSGDCTGIGPEQTARILSQDHLAATARLVVIGDARVLDMGMSHAGVRLEVERIASPGRASWPSRAVQLVDLGNTDPARFALGKPNAESGRLTGETLSRAIDFAKSGEVDAITFAPLNKRAMFDGGWKFPDEHKMFASLLGHQGYFSEMNVLDGQWMSRVTGHVALRDALDCINPGTITDAIELVDSMMRKAGIARPRIAVAALNPHAGEGGLFGREDIDVSTPTIERMRMDGLNVSGPVPGDTVFVKLRAGHYDAVVAMYHDQGHIPVKLLGFQIDPATQKWSALNGVNITLGLPIIRTSVDHGTAFDIAGKSIANEDSLIEAIDYALRLGASKVS